MATYYPITSFTVKDGLTTGNPAKIVKGADIDVELNAISSAINAKLDTTGFFATGTKLPFYQASAPSGWTDAALTDVALVAVTQASTNGGSTVGSWSISGLTVSDPTHFHGAGTLSISTNAVTMTPGGNNVAQHTVYSVVGTTAAASTGITVAGDGTWRPARAYVIICSKN
jgi:hypothetical protein